MGEYANRKSDGQRIKIGTCEDLMGGLRPDQLDATDYPFTAANLKHFLFRFPFPGEDGTEPGDFENYPDGLAVWGAWPPRTINHDKVQFKAGVGILVSLPCPRGPEPLDGVTVHYNGYCGPVKIVGQRAWGGAWALVAKCGDCGAFYRHERLEDAQQVIDALRAMARSEQMRDQYAGIARFYGEVADRIERGYSTPAELPARGDVQPEVVTP